MKVNHQLAKQIGKSRCYCRRQFKKLLQSYAKENCLHEQWGQLTKRRCELYLSKLRVDRSISYQDWCDVFVEDLDALISVLADTLNTSTWSSNHDSQPQRLQKAEEILKDWKFFSDFDSEKYDF